MSTLNDSNIEEWIFDYHEGNLTENQQKSLLAYIEVHPEFQEDFQLWEQAKMPAGTPEEINYENYIKKDKPGFGNFAIIGGITAILLGIFCIVYLPIKPKNSIETNNLEIGKTIQETSSKINPFPKKEEKNKEQTTLFQQEKTKATPTSKSISLDNPENSKIEIKEPTVIKINEQEIITNTEKKNLDVNQEIQKTNIKLQEIPVVIQKDSLVNDNTQKNNSKSKKGIQIKMKNTPIND